MDSLEELTQCLTSLFSAWPYPYYFAAVLDAGDRSLAQPVLHIRQGENIGDSEFNRQESPVPDAEAVLGDRSVRIVLAQLLQNEEETLGYLVSGVHEWTLRDQERFEEEALFLSAALNAVIGNRRLEAANNAILRMAEHDYLTGLYNRRGFLRELERRLKLPETQHLTLTLFAMDMDRLKYVNDVYGHQEGDLAIQSLAYALRAETEGRGICARYGGDEFAFAFLTEESMLPLLNDIRKRIETRAREMYASGNCLISASLGACSCPVKGHHSLDSLLAEADRALYTDKNARRQKR